MYKVTGCFATITIIRILIVILISKNGINSILEFILLLYPNKKKGNGIFR